MYFTQNRCRINFEWKSESHFTNNRVIFVRLKKQRLFSYFHSNVLFFQESGEGRNSSDCRDNEIKKWQLAPLRKMGQPVLPRRSSEEKSEKIPKESTTVTCTGEKASKPGSEMNRNIYILIYLYPI